jgi:hypothetical protein
MMLGDIPHAYYVEVPLGHLRFARNGTSNGTLGESGIPQAVDRTNLQAHDSAGTLVSGEPDSTCFVMELASSVSTARAI